MEDNSHRKRFQYKYWHGWVATAIALFISSLFCGYDWRSKNFYPWADWTGFGEDATIEVSVEKNPDGKIKRTETTKPQSGKTLWEWLGLAGTLAIPVLLAYLSYQFQRRDQQRAEAQAQVEKERAEKQAQVEREIANANLRDEALQAYIDRMAELLLNKEFKKELVPDPDELEMPDFDNSVRDVARIRTVTILRRLEGDIGQQARVLHFLKDAELLNSLLKNATLERVNLVGANLSDADLSNANLSYANLSYANLEGVYLWDTNLEGANLEGANLEGAYLEKAKINDATKLDDKWRRVWLIANRGAKGQNLSNADLSRAILRKANLEKANLVRANLEGANLNEANLEGANLEGVNLEGARLRETNLVGTNLAGANLKGARLSGVSLKGTNLEKANMMGVELWRTSLVGAKIDDATKLDDKWRRVWLIANRGAKGQNLSNADLSDADFSCANLSYTNLSYANLSYASLSYTDLERAELSNSILKRADLVGANLVGANLVGANLRGANLVGANLVGANLEKTELEGAELEKAKYTDGNTKSEVCRRIDLAHPCATKFPLDFDPKAAKMVLVRNLDDLRNRYWGEAEESG